MLSSRWPQGVLDPSQCPKEHLGVGGEECSNIVWDIYNAGWACDKLIVKEIGIGRQPLSQDAFSFYKLF